MALPGSIHDREYQKFGLNSLGETAVRTITEITGTSVVQVLGEDIVNIYDEALAVPASSLTDVVSYTIPVGKLLYVNLIETSGENKAVFTVDLNGSTIAKKRSYFTDYNLDFDFDSLKLIAGDIIKVQVNHDRPATANFEARILGVLKDA